MIAHRAPVTSVGLTGREVALRRREAALERQRASRSALFELGRRVDVEAAFDALDLRVPDAPTDAGEGMEDDSVVWTADVPPSAKQIKLSRARTKWERRYGDKLMFADLLDHVPADLDERWIALAAPPGKRCLVITLGDPAHAQTLLLSRSKGRPLARRSTALPQNTILDAIWDRDRSILFVLDALEWNGLPLSGHDFESRRFWRDTKLAELAPQQWSPHPKATTLAVVAVPTGDVPSAFLPQAVREGLSVSLTVRQGGETVDPDAMVEGSQPPSIETVAIPVVLDGVLLLMREALYESGPTCLAGWLPVAHGHLAAVIESSSLIS